jgi:hypothetical protein
MTEAQYHEQYLYWFGRDELDYLLYFNVKDHCEPWL